MKIAISTEGDYVSEHFGRCPYFTFFEVSDGIILKRELVQNIEHSPGAVPKFLKEKGVDLIISGGMGRKAVDLFRTFGIEIIIGAQGKIDDIIEKYLKGNLKVDDESSKPCGGGHPDRECAKNEDEIICITSEGNDLNSNVDERFGRCSWFLVFNLNDFSYEAVENPYKEEMGGAGIKVVKFLAEKGVKTLLTGNLGKNAKEALEAAKIKVLTDVKGTVKEAVEKFVLGFKKI